MRRGTSKINARSFVLSAPLSFPFLSFFFLSTNFFAPSILAGVSSLVESIFVIVKRAGGVYD